MLLDLLFEMHLDELAEWDARFRRETGLWIINDYAGRLISCPTENLPFNPDEPPATPRLVVAQPRLCAYPE